MINPMVDKDGNISTAGFDDYQRGVLQGIGYATEALNNLKYDYRSDSAPLYEKVLNSYALEVIDDCINHVTDEGVTMATAFQDESYDETAPEAAGDMPASKYLFKRG